MVFRSIGMKVKKKKTKKLRIFIIFVNYWDLSSSLLAYMHWYLYRHAYIHTYIHMRIYLSVKYIYIYIHVYTYTNCLVFGVRQKEFALLLICTDTEAKRDKRVREFSRKRWKAKAKNKIISHSIYKYQNNCTHYTRIREPIVKFSSSIWHTAISKTRRDKTRQDKKWITLITTVHYHCICTFVH